MTTIETITFVNNSTYKGVDVEANLTKIADAVSRQIRYHAAPAWQRLPMAVVANVHAAAGVFPIHLFDNADVAGALGYHDETPDGLPYGRVFLDVILNNGGTWFDGSLSVSQCFSHEALELFGDKSVNQWASDLSGTLYAVELCDPVEEDSYVMDGTEVSVSNFIYDTWFDRNYKGKKFDHMGRLNSAFSMTRGGYFIYSSQGNPQQKFADEVPEWRKESKDFPAARTAKRLKVNG